MGHVSRAKTAAPRLPPAFVVRPALLTALDAGEERALTLVCAPPGYGKTVLLADWAGRQHGTCAWVALDEEDDHPPRLWESVLAALTACPAVPATSRLRRLVAPRTTVGVDFLTDLIEGLAAVPGRVRLVLDDAHHLRSRETLHGLQLFLRDRPDNSRLVLASRIDPELPVARLRLEERLLELRTEELSFSADETAALARACGLGLTDAQAAVLRGRTGGWVAGIRLATLRLRDHPDPEAFLAAFSGDDRAVADYLAGEVIAGISAEDGELLRRSSITDPIPTALAAELSGRADAADALAVLERTTGMVIATGAHRTEFRMQGLLRSYLAAELLRHGPALAAQLHRQAAVWWSARSRPVEALGHAAAAADGALLTSLLHRWAPTLVARGEHTALRRALTAVDGNAAGAEPWLPLVSAQMHLANGDLAAARADVRRARMPDDGPRDGDLALFWNATSGLVGIPSRNPGNGPAPQDEALAALVLAGRGATGAFRGPDEGSSHDPAELDDLEAALSLARAQHLDLLELQCLCLVGVAAASAGDHRRAGDAAAAAITAAAAQGRSDSAWTSAAHAVLAHILLIRAAPARALQVAVAGLRLRAAGLEPVVRFALRTARGGALLDAGDPISGLLELQEAHAQRGGLPLPTAVAASAALLEHRAALLVRSPAAAATAVSRLTAGEVARAEVTLMQAWAEAAAGSTRQARGTVGPLLDGRVAPALSTTLVEAWLVEVRACLRSGDRPGARAALQIALALAEPLDALRPFALAGQGVRGLLVDQLGGLRDPSAFAFRCLSARQHLRQSPAPQLSARERDVLTQLLSLSNLGEIADDLAVSINTVKSHVRSIYGKLGVNTRRTAVLTAVERGLLA